MLKAFFIFVQHHHLWWLKYTNLFSFWGKRFSTSVLYILSQKASGRFGRRTRLTELLRRARSSSKLWLHTSMDVCCSTASFLFFSFKLQIKKKNIYTGWETGQPRDTRFRWVHDRKKKKQKINFGMMKKVNFQFKEKWFKFSEKITK